MKGAICYNEDKEAVDAVYGIELDIQLSSDGVAMGAKTAGWTRRSYEDYEVAKEDYDLYIFDSFALEAE